MLAFSSAPPPTCVAPATRPLRASESHPSSSDRKTQLTDFFKSLQILRARFRCMTSFTSPSPFWDFIIFTNPSARAGYDTRSIFKQS